MKVVERPESDLEETRIAALLRLLPRGRRTVLDLGARDGYISQFLTEYFEHVTALDLEEPQLQMDRVTTVKGDASDLGYADGAFDTIVCAEVLEHIPPELLPRVCSEISRVAKHEVVIGTPYRQDTRVGRIRCLNCDSVNPPWGHVNRMDEETLVSLFRGLKPTAKEFIGTQRERTNALSAFLLNVAGNPWPSIGPDQRCLSCGQKLAAPDPQRMGLGQMACSKVAVMLTRIQRSLTPPEPIWIHMVFSKSQ